jgi:hypothetical protein
VGAILPIFTESIHHYNTAYRCAAGSGMRQSCAAGSIIQHKFDRGTAVQLEKQSLLHCCASIKFELDIQYQD